MSNMIAYSTHAIRTATFVLPYITMFLPRLGPITKSTITSQSFSYKVISFKFLMISISKPSLLAQVSKSPSPPHLSLPLSLSLSQKLTR